VDDKNLWRFFVRARAIDKASNQGEHVYEKVVMIDLEKPSAEIHRVHVGPNGGQVRESERPTVSTSGMPVTPSPVSPNPVTPVITPPLTPADPSSQLQPVPGLPIIK
jgi:hypothetical protein